MVETVSHARECHLPQDAITTDLLGEPLEAVPLRTAYVLLPIPADRPYSYAVPEGMDVQPGDYVQVPLGPRKVASVVWDAPVGDNGVDP